MVLHEARRSQESTLASLLQPSQRNSIGTPSPGGSSDLTLAPSLGAAREFYLQLDSFVDLDQPYADVQRRANSLQTLCSGCGAVAVGLRKCSACRRAQYVSVTAAPLVSASSTLDTCRQQCSRDPHSVPRTSCRPLHVVTLCCHCSSPRTPRSARPRARSGTGPATAQSAGRLPLTPLAAARAASPAKQL